MPFSNESIDRFMAIYERKFNEPITKEDATLMAWRLVNMYRLFRRPLPPAGMREQGERRAEGEPISSGQPTC